MHMTTSHEMCQSQEPLEPFHFQRHFLTFWSCLDKWMPLWMKWFLLNHGVWTDEAAAFFVYHLCHTLMALRADFKHDRICYFITCVTFLCDMIIFPLNAPVHYSKSNFEISEENSPIIWLANRKVTGSNSGDANTVKRSLWSRKGFTSRCSRDLTPR